VDVGFPELLLIVGLLLAAAAGLSGLFHGTVLSISVLSVTAGIVLALAGVVQVRPDDEDIVHVIELALVFTLFSDGLVADRELVRRRWHPPARRLPPLRRRVANLYRQCASASSRSR
jgi:NhaP-type Na+/H+ or K+/H+ antiporter